MCSLLCFVCGGCVCVCVCVHSFTQSCLTPCDPMDCSWQAPRSMGFVKQKYWSGLPFPTPGDLSNSGIKPESHALADGFATWEAPFSCQLLFKSCSQQNWVKIVDVPHSRNASNFVFICVLFSPLHWHPCIHKATVVLVNCISVSCGFPGGSEGKDSACNTGDLDLH